MDGIGRRDRAKRLRLYCLERAERFPGRGDGDEEAEVKIDRIETFTKGYLCIVRVTADNGAEGYGQVAPYNADISELVLMRQVCPHFLGAEPKDVDMLAEQ